MNLSTLSELKDFLARHDHASPRYEYWVIADHMLSAALKGPQGFIPAGLYEHTATSLEDLQNHFCEHQEGVGHTVFQVINLDLSDEEPMVFVNSAVRADPPHDGILLFSKSTGRLVQTREAIAQSTVSTIHALFLVHIMQ